MAFNKLTSTKIFTSLNSTLDGKIIILKVSNIVFSLLNVLVSDVNWQKSQYKKIFGRELNLCNPQTFSEKLLYLKLFYKNPLIHLCADKHFVYDYVKMLDLENILIPVLGVYNRAEEIEFDSLPNRFFIKVTQGSGGNLLVDKKAKDYNPKMIREYYNELRKRDYYKIGREWSYKGLKSKLMIVPEIFNRDGSPLVDYKFYCFEGKLRYYMVSYGEYEYNVRNHKFDANNQSIDHLFKEKTVLASDDIQLPSNIEEMKQIAERLSKPFPHVRVDLYNVDGKILFGELTFYSSGGFVKVFNDEMNRKIASWIHLEKYKDDMFFSKGNYRYHKALGN